MFLCKSVSQFTHTKNPQKITMSDLQKERQIPVLTVWKNNAILKNIFLINTPPNTSNDNDNDNDDNENGFRGFEETLLVGRHPDCDIRLEHPSISRFHFKIHSFPSNNLLFITDLSSVHGTWVSGKKIEPNIRTLVKESDDLRIGGSSRVYKLQWIPLSQAYDASKPFMPPLDFPCSQEDEDDGIKDEYSLGLKDEEVQNVDNISDDISKGLESLDLSEDNKMVAQKVIPPALPLQPQRSLLVTDEVNELVDIDFEGLESLDDISLEQKEVVLALPVDNEDFEYEDVQSVDSILEGLVPLFMGKNGESIGVQGDKLQSSKDEDSEYASLVWEGLDSLFSDQYSGLLAHNINLSPPLMTEDIESPTQKLDSIRMEGRQECASRILGNKKQSTLQEENAQDNAWSFWYDSCVAPSSPAIVGGPLDTEGLVLCTENEDPQHEAGSLVDLSAKVKQDSEPWSFWSGKMGVESVYSELSDEAFSESENMSLISDCLSSPVSSCKGQICNPLITPEQNSARSILSRGGKQSFCSKPFSESENESCGNYFKSPDPFSSVKGRSGSPFMTSDQNPVDSNHSIWSRRGKLANTPQVLTSRTKEKKMKTGQKNVKHEPISRVLFHGTNDDEHEEKNDEEEFTPDKENLTPSTHKSMRKFAVLKEIKKSSSGLSPLSKMSSSPSNHCGNIISPLLDKENYSLGTQQKSKTAKRASAKQVRSDRLKERKGQRVPFQSLLANSPQKNSTECYIADKGECIREGIQQWKMVVDTTILLNKESRKALQLLEGLKGTKLIIPRIVISELASLKRQLSFFRRNSEVLSALEWIQDCMVKTPCWVHVQGSTEEGRPVAPTPPTSPCSELSFGTAGSCAFSGLGSRMELLSPTAEDDVLDYALSFRKSNTDGQLVLLSSDITMKIKAMAEGMICERSEEFRESLVNPFSERFLWTDSTPRGRTWSCTDDIVLKEKFYPRSMKMTPKAMESVKGLKLILLHNSQYHERVTTIH